MKKLSALLLILSIFSSCKSTEGSGKSAVQLQGLWELTDIEIGSFERLFYKTSAPTIQFDTVAMQVSGRNSCNQYSGPYTSGNGTLSFDGQRMISTKMYCEGAGEQSYMQALISSNAFQLSEDGKKLTLLKDGQQALVFVKIKDQE